MTSCDNNPGVAGVNVAFDVFLAPSGLSHSMRQTVVVGDPIRHSTKPLHPCSLAFGVSTDEKVTSPFAGIRAGGTTSKSPRSCFASPRVSSWSVLLVTVIRQLEATFGAGVGPGGGTGPGLGGVPPLALTSNWKSSPPVLKPLTSKRPSSGVIVCVVLREGRSPPRSHLKNNCAFFSSPTML